LSLLASVSVPAGAQEAKIPRRPDGKPDLTGRWLGSAGGLTHTVILEDHPGGFGIQAGPSLIIDPPDGVIPYQPWARVERDRRREDVYAYEDPVGHCEFYDVGRLHSFAMQFHHSSDGNIIIHAQQHITRNVYMNRREHLPPGIRLWTGDSIGRWEGDTLVIETMNFSGKTRLALGGDFYGPDARLTERLRMVNADTINWTLTVDDPNVFTRPWTMRSAAPLARQKPVVDYDDEDTCHEGNLPLVHLRNMYEKHHPGVWPANPRVRP
jgi:hypothetical protein